MSISRMLADDAPGGQAPPTGDFLVGPAELTIVIPTLAERLHILPLIERLSNALGGVAWEAIFVDDDSADGTIDAVWATSRHDSRIRGIRRIGRRGLAGACLEGMLASSAPYLAVMDADLQHDETRLPEMLAFLKKGQADLVVASRYAMGESVRSGLSRGRSFGTQLATFISRALLRHDVSDPMSGFFALRREVVESVAHRLSTQGFKILLDILACSPKSLRL